MFQNWVSLQAKHKLLAALSSCRNVSPVVTQPTQNWEGGEENGSSVSRVFFNSLGPEWTHCYRSSRVGIARFLSFIVMVFQVSVDRLLSMCSFRALNDCFTLNKWIMSAEELNIETPYWKALEGFVVVLLGRIRFCVFWQEFRDLEVSVSTFGSKFNNCLKASKGWISNSLTT